MGKLFVTVFADTEHITNYLWFLHPDARHWSQQ